MATSTEPGKHAGLLPTLSLAEIPAAALRNQDVPSWRRQLLEALETSRTTAELSAALAAAAEQILPEANLLYATRTSDGNLSEPQLFYAREKFMLSQDDSQILTMICQRACSGQRSRFQILPRHGRCVAMATPVFLRGKPPEAICLIADAARDLKLLQAQLEALAAYPTFWHDRQSRSGSATAEPIQWLEMIGRIMAAEGREEAARRLAHGLQSWLGCQRVAIGCPGPAGHRVVAVSGQQRVDPRAELSRALSAALDEVAQQPHAIRWDAAETDRQVDWPTLRRAAQMTSSNTLIGTALRVDDERPVATVLLLYEGGQPPQRNWNDLQPVWTLFARVLSALFAARQTTFWSRGQRWMSFGSHSRRRTFSVAVAALTAVLLCPVYYRPACRFTIEPVTRRYVVAPFAGILEHSLVEAGDIVEAQQPLARMDQRELRWELATLEAQHHQAAKRYDSALAMQAAADAQLAKYEMEQFQSRIDALQDRQQELTIRSPIRGVIVRGDLKRSVGAPLTIGQTLYEVAPLQQMIAEVAVPEDEIAFAKAGQTVRLRLDADPLQRLKARVARIHPRAELRDHENVFIADVHLPNAAGTLRPGMSGRARLTGPIRPLIWTILRRPVRYLLQGLGW